MRLPAFPPPRLARVFGRRDAPAGHSKQTAAVLALQARLGLDAVPARFVRWALTDPGWCNEAQTPAWRPPWPPNTVLEQEGTAALQQVGLDPEVLGTRLAAAGAWDALFLAPGQRHLPTRGRARILARSAAALVAVSLRHGVSMETWTRIASGAPPG